MTRKTILAVTALLPLAACDYAGIGIGGNEAAEANTAAQANQTASLGGKPTGDGTQQQGQQVASAGVTTSRSLQFGQGDLGGKVPTDMGAGGDVTPAMLLGTWTDNGDCQMGVEFISDGTFRSYNGGGGEWRLDGDSLQLSGGNGTLTLQLRATDNDTILATNPDGSVGRSTRC